MVVDQHLLHTHFLFHSHCVPALSASSTKVAQKPSTRVHHATRDMVRHTRFLHNRASLEPIDNVLPKLQHEEWCGMWRNDYVTCTQRAMLEAGSDVEVCQSRFEDCWNNLADARKLCMSTYSTSTGIRLRYNPMRTEEVRRFDGMEGVVRLKQRNPPWMLWNLKLLECSAAVAKS